MTVTFVIESMSIANAIIKKERRFKGSYFELRIEILNY